MAAVFNVPNFLKKFDHGDEMFGLGRLLESCQAGDTEIYRHPFL